MEKNNKYTAEMLKEKYCVWGSFYTLRYPGGATLGCRNGLEIFTINQTSRLLEVALPDALFVMMNPGSSHPCEKEFVLPIHKTTKINNKNGLRCVWVQTQPDNAQYQVMRVMEYMGWNYVRVINLSDIRCPKSHEFRDMLKVLSGADPEHLHSIFSEKRKGELKEMLLIKKGAPIVMAWGKDNWLEELAGFGFHSLPSESRLGVPSDKSKILFAHASPILPEHKDRWLYDILGVLR